MQIQIAPMCNSHQPTNQAINMIMRVKSIGAALVIGLALQSGGTHADEIDAQCGEKWGNDADMVAYCVDEQRTAKLEISAYSGEIRSSCEAKWVKDYEMTLHCIDSQSTAKTNLSASPNDEILKACELKWNTDYEMIKHCDDSQRGAKRTIEKVYGEHVKRSGCAKKWGGDHEMVLYCIRE